MIRRVHGRRWAGLRAALAVAVALTALAPVLRTTGAPVVGGPLTLPDGRLLTPAGTMVSAGDFPAGALLTGGALDVVTAGETVNQVLAVNPATLATVAVVPAAPPSTSEAFYAQTGGLAVSPDGGTLFTAGGATATVHRFSLTATVPVQTGSIAVPGFAGDVAVSSDASALFVTQPFSGAERNDKGSTVVRVPVAGGASISAPVGAVPWSVVDLTPPGGAEVAVVAGRDSGTLTVLDAGTLRRVATVATGRQPAAMRATHDRRDLLVLDSLDDELVVVDTTTWTVRSRLSLGLGTGLGSAPSALDLSPDGQTAVVALSADNAVAVLHRLGGTWMLAGRIPTAWYPTAVQWDPTGPRLLVTAGKGVGLPPGTPPGAPVTAAASYNPGSSGLGVSGVVESIPVPSAADLATDTAQVIHNDVPAAASAATGQPAPGASACPLQPDQVRHVVYIIRENKTYDEEFGDEPGGAAANVMYPRQVTPNTHALAEQFALLQGFYADEEVSDTGHQALMGGTPNDWTERLAQQAYGLDGAPRPGAELGNDSSINWAPANYLLDNALLHGLTFRDYGEFYRRDQVTDAAVSAALQAHIVTGFPHFGFDPGYPDTGRVAFWQGQFAADVAHGTFPQLEVIYLPEDHTTTGLSPLPQQQVADSDLATGRIVDSLSHSPYWDSTAVFLTEDDPQSGVDSVDEHRTIGLVVGPHVRRGVATATHWDQGSMLRTMETVLHLPPMTAFDATAVPMTDLLTGAADDTPYSAITPVVPLPSGATVAATRALVQQRLGARAGDPTLVPSPADQRDIQWLATHGTPYAPTGAHPSAVLESRGAVAACPGAQPAGGPSVALANTGSAAGRTGAASLLVTAGLLAAAGGRRRATSQRRR